MVVHLDSEAADKCTQVCGAFIDSVSSLHAIGVESLQSSSSSSFKTARQISTVYSLFAGDDLNSLLSDFIDQASAMSMLFAASGGLIEAQDEALVAALSKATEEPAGLQSLGLMGSLTGMTDLLDAADGTTTLGGYDRVGPEDVSDTPLERIAAAAEALEPGQFDQVQAHLSAVSQKLDSAVSQLQSDLDSILGAYWQGEVAAQAQDSVRGLTTSAHDLVGDLEKVAERAQRAHNGFSTTRARIGEQAAALAEATESRSSFSGGVDAGGINRIRKSLEAAEQARSIVNTEYSPAVMDANLDDLDFTTAYRVVSTTALGGPNGIDMARIWNTDGIPRPATAATPSAAAIAAASGGGADLGMAGGGTAGGAGIVTTTSLPIAPTDAATEQALLASRAGGVDGAGAVAAPAGQAGSGGGVNASTTAAGAPFAPAATAGGQRSGAGSGGIRGLRGAGNSNRDRDRGFGSATGLVGGGGAAAAGAAASRLGGAGTLAGIGGGAGVSGGAGAAGGGAGTGAFGAGSASAGAAGSGAGASSSSSSGGAQAGRAGAMPMGAMAGAAGAGQNSDRRGHTPAGYLTNATNTTAIIGEPLKVSPAVLGRKPIEEPAGDKPEPFRGRVIGRDYTGRGAR